MDAAQKEERLIELFKIASTVKVIHTTIGANVDPALLDEPIKKLATIDDEEMFVEFYARNLGMLVEMLQSAETVTNYIRKQNDQVAETVDVYQEKKEFE